MNAKEKVIEIIPIDDPKQSYDRLEFRLRKFFRDHIYIPILKELGISVDVIKNAISIDPNTALIDAIFKGDVIYTKGSFSGKFNARISKELRDIGAKFDKKTGTYKLYFSKIPTYVKQIISASETNFKYKMEKLDEKLSKLVPEELAKSFKSEDIFDKALFKADQNFKTNVKKIAVVPELTKEQREDISKKWQDNVQLAIKDWTGQQIKDLRTKIFEDVMAGERKESFIPTILKVTQTIQASHDQALNKAKFLAHQETRLLMTAFKQTRYESIGSKSYIWRTVHRPADPTPDHHTLGNVRYTHGLLNGKEIQWSDPPITSNPGEPVRKNHPGQDYNCRCFSRPIIRK